MLKGFNVTFSLVTEESARQGDEAESGFVAKDLTLREAVESFFERTHGTNEGPVESNVWPHGDGSSIRWVSQNGSWDDEAGVEESRALHLPEYVRPASRLRIARLLVAV